MVEHPTAPIYLITLSVDSIFLPKFSDIVIRDMLERCDLIAEATRLVALATMLNSAANL